MIKPIIKYFLAILAMFLPILAFGADIFAPPSNDVSLKILNQIFGGLVDGGNDAFGDAMAVFNGAALSIGGILAAYAILAGTLATAHDGEMLGKKFSSIYVPIRYSLGTALILPVLPGGYCVMAALVMWIVKQGIGLAGIVWASYVAQPGASAIAKIDGVSKVQLEGIAIKMFEASLCAASKKQAVEDIPKEDNVLMIKDRVKFGVYKTSENIGFGYGVGDSAYSCGRINYTSTDRIGDYKIDGTSVSGQDETTYQGYLGPLDRLFSSPNLTSVIAAQKNATEKMADEMFLLAQKSVEKVKNKEVLNPDEVKVAIKNSVNSYAKTIESSIPKLKSDNELASETAKENGWILAGAYFINTISVNNKINSIMTAFPNVTTYNSPYAGGIGIAKDSKKYINTINEQLGEIVSKKGDIKDEKNKEAEEDEVTGNGTAFVANIASVFTTIDFAELNNDSRHPILIINEMGNRMITIWASAMALMIGASVVASAKIDLFFIKADFFPVLVVILSFVFAPILAITATGFFAAYLIPMMPFMIWLGCVGGFLIQAIIAIIASPLWAVMHLHPNGDDVAGKGAAGYMMVLGLLLRPTLLVFGFIAAVVLSSVLGEFINKIYFQVFEFSEGSTNSGIGILSMVFASIVYVILMYSFITKCFSIIHVIPDELLKWIGGGGEQVGSYAKTMGNAGGFQAAAGFMAGRSLNSGLQNINQGLNNLAQRRHDKTTAAKDDEYKAAQLNWKKTESDIGVDQTYGAGVSDSMNNALKDVGEVGSASRLNAEASYKKGLERSLAIGGQAGVQEFVDKVNASAEYGFEGGADSAIKGIASQITPKAEQGNRTIKGKEGKDS